MSWTGARYVNSLSPSEPGQMLEIEMLRTHMGMGQTLVPSEAPNSW